MYIFSTIIGIQQYKQRRKSLDAKDLSSEDRELIDTCAYIGVQHLDTGKPHLLICITIDHILQNSKIKTSG